MDQIITQCPNCGTSFRVTPQQLQVANGAVRCGSCMHIFQAVSHQPQKASTKFEHQKPAVNNEKAHELTQDNTSEFSESFLGLDDWKDGDNDARQYGMDQLDDDSNETDEHWAEKLLAEAESEPTIPPSHAPTQKKNLSRRTERQPVKTIPRSTGKPEQAKESSDSELPDLESPDIGLSFSALDDEPLFSDDEPVAHPPHIRRQFINHIEPEPLELHYDDRSHWLANTLWSLALGLAIVALVGQVFFFEFDRLSRDPIYRPWYALVCKQLHCTLPDLEDIRLIRASNLMVRTHPEIEDALIVDAIVMNLASYPQQFPDLELIFTNMQGKIVSGRLFKVNEYLNGELAGASLMPPQRPIHLSLEIADPGQNATNYSLQLHLPKAG